MEVRLRDGAVASLLERVLDVCSCSNLIPTPAPSLDGRHLQGALFVLTLCLSCFCFCLGSFLVVHAHRERELHGAGTRFYHRFS